MHGLFENVIGKNFLDPRTRILNSVSADRKPGVDAPGFHVSGSW